MNYLHYNPIKHGLVKMVVHWPYSSFHRYVKQGSYAQDWGGSSMNFSENFPDGLE